jgi:hypothetical protein
MPHQYRVDRIVTYEDWDSWVDKGFGYRAFLEFSWKGPLPPDSQIQPGSINAYINEGRWIADCYAGCGGALLVTPADPWFFCCECGSGWYQIVFPGKITRTKIEAELMKRPTIGGVPRTRNWIVGETVDQLKVQNLEHGVE